MKFSKFLVTIFFPGRKFKVFFFLEYKRYFVCRKFERFSFHFAYGHQLRLSAFFLSYENKRVPLGVLLFNEPNGPEKKSFHRPPVLTTSKLI